MTTPQRVYVVEHGDKKHLVQATSSTVATNHVVQGLTKTKIAKPLEIVELMQSGVKLEVANATPVPASE